MRVCYHGKDGGKDSTVWGYWLIELKRWFSVVVLRFETGTRDAYHDHAFESVSWLLAGTLVEKHRDGTIDTHRPGLVPITTRRNTFHQVESIGRSWVLSFRGPWTQQWHEYRPAEGRCVTLTNGRQEVR